VNINASTLQIFNVSNAAAPALVSTIGTGNQPYCVAVSGSYAYVVNNFSNTLQTFNISNPAAPTSVGSVPAGGNALSLVVSGSYAFVGDIGANGLQVFSLSNPAAPALVGNLAGASPLCVAVSGDYAYVGNFLTGELQVVSPFIQMDLGVPVSASNLTGVNGSGLTNVLPVMSWNNAVLSANSITSGSNAYSGVEGTYQTSQMRKGVAVVNWSTSAFSDVATPTMFLVRVRAVTNGVATVGPSTRFSINGSNTHQMVSGNAVITIPTTDSTTFVLEVARATGPGSYKTDSNDSFTGSIINIPQ
jgi:hypothetical protein